VLHELATNAVKYGALKGERGFVELNWCTQGEKLALSWSERGGPPITRPLESTGFGTRLSRRTIVGQFHGELSYEWRPDGLSVAMNVPLANLSR